MTPLAALLVCSCGLALTLGQQLSVDLRTGDAYVAGSDRPDTGFEWVDQPPFSPSHTTCDLRGLLKLTFDKINHVRAEISMTFENQIMGWNFNIGDSVSNDGYGGDYGHQSNDAEIHNINRTIFFYGKNVRPFQSYGRVYSLDNFVTEQVTINVMDQLVTAYNGHDFVYIESFKMFQLSGQPDATGPVNNDVYVAMNRVVKDRSDRVGRGLCRMLITWHSDAP